MSALAELRWMRERMHGTAHLIGSGVLLGFVRDIEARIAELEAAPPLAQPGDAVRSLALEIADCGIEYETPSTMVIQIPRETWDELQAMRDALGGDRG